MMTNVFGAIAHLALIISHLTLGISHRTLGDEIYI